MLSTNNIAKFICILAINLNTSNFATAATHTGAPDPEDRLIEAQQLFVKGRSNEAILKVEALIKDVPTFRAAHLLYGDLLLSRSGSKSDIEAFQKPLPADAAEALSDLRTESKLRVQAMQNSPPAGTIPSQFFALTAQNKHAIAVDASKSRLYLFENTTNGFALKENHYVSVGKLGIGKNIEGDQRTPLGVYFLSRKLAASELPTLYGGGFYGKGALTLNYPNQLDVLRGKTGGGIWLHGTPPKEYARAPKATNGCVALSNPQLDRIMKSVALGSTPFVIADSISWVKPHNLNPERTEFIKTLTNWHKAKQTGNVQNLTSFYQVSHLKNQKNADRLFAIAGQQKNQDFDANNYSILRWKDSSETMIVTYSEIQNQSKSGKSKRQYWTRDGSQWRIFFEGEVS
jgi:murein L,D-transpeptidase YafK